MANKNSMFYRDPYCDGCKFRGTISGIGYCAYWEKQDKKRPCKPGKDCTFSPMNGGDKATPQRNRWDYDKLHAMYLSGIPMTAICEETGVPKATLGGYICRYGWAAEREKANPGAARKLRSHKTPAWDVELGKELYFAQYKMAEICEICKVGYNALAFYIQNKGWNKERKEAMSNNNTTGIKDKTGKPPLGMTFALRKAVNAIAYVREFGLTKYPNADNWKRVPMQDWADAAERHLTAWQSGEKVDPESGMSHLWHALCNLAYMVELEIE